MYTLCMWDALISLRWVHYRGLNVRRVFARTVCGISDLAGSDSPLLHLSCHLHLAFVSETSASGQVALWLYFIHGSETGRVGQPPTLPPSLLMISEWLKSELKQSCLYFREEVVMHNSRNLRLLFVCYKLFFLKYEASHFLYSSKCGFDFYRIARYI